MYSTGTGNLNRGHSRLPFRQKDGVRLCASEPGTRIVSGGVGGVEGWGGGLLDTPAEWHGAFAGESSSADLSGTMAEEGNQGLH